MEHEDAKTEKLKTRRRNTVENIEDCRWQKNSLEIDQLKKEIEEVSNWKFILDNNNIMKTNAGKIWIPKEKKSEMIMFMHVMLSHAGAEKVTK